MDHNIPLITTLAAGFGIALALGFIAERLKFPALVGYLVAGILIGPATPGFVADIHIAAQLSEIGVMLLMFGVGLHFSLADCRRFGDRPGIGPFATASYTSWGKCRCGVR